MREVHQDETSQVELFLNSVPILASLTREEKMMLVDALEEQAYAPASRVINQVSPAPSHALHAYLLHTTLMHFSKHAYCLCLKSGPGLPTQACAYSVSETGIDRHTLYHMFTLTHSKLCGLSTIHRTMNSSPFILRTIRHLHVALNQHDESSCFARHAACP